MLYICPTPIGNLGDITMRVLEVLRSVHVVACEDTRHTGGLLSHYGIKARLLSNQEHNEQRRLDTLLPLLREGKDVALVSDAGMPGLSDPGFTLVRACTAEGLPVTVLPGASAIDTALVASGLPTDRFTFAGFLPRGSLKLVAFLESAGAGGGTVVAFESGRRLAATLAAVAKRWPERRLAVCRELTKLHEQVLRGTAAEAAVSLGDEIRGEVVLVLAPAGEGGETVCRANGLPGGAAVDATDDVIVAEMQDLLQKGLTVRDVSDAVARLGVTPRRKAYDLALQAKRRLTE
jgi:16S rRNA (cytidine1402-2'-O)-methyltransferase